MYRSLIRMTWFLRECLLWLNTHVLSLLPRADLVQTCLSKVTILLALLYWSIESPCLDRSNSLITPSIYKANWQKNVSCSLLSRALEHSLCKKARSFILLSIVHWDSLLWRISLATTSIFWKHCAFLCSLTLESALLVYASSSSNATVPHQHLNSSEKHNALHDATRW